MCVDEWPKNICDIRRASFHGRSLAPPFPCDLSFSEEGETRAMRRCNCPVPPALSPARDVSNIVHSLIVLHLQSLSTTALSLPYCYCAVEKTGRSSLQQPSLVLHAPICWFVSGNRVHTRRGVSRTTTILTLDFGASQTSADKTIARTASAFYDSTDH